MTGHIVDSRPHDMLERHSRISRRRVAMFGALPVELALWWTQIQQAAAAESLEPGAFDDWLGPAGRARKALLGLACPARGHPTSRSKPRPPSARPSSPKPSTRPVKSPASPNPKHKKGRKVSLPALSGLAH